MNLVHVVGLLVSEVLDHINTFQKNGQKVEIDAEELDVELVQMSDH